MNKAAIVWMSPGNSYFKPVRIRNLLIQLSKEYDYIAVVSPASLATHTYRALGYVERKAQKKARNNTQRFLNHARRVRDQHALKNVALIDWDAIEKKKAYINSYNYVRGLYDNKGEFYQDAYETAKAVLENKSNESLDCGAVNEGVKYLLKELAFCWASNELLCVSKVDYVYHHGWQIFENLVDGKYTGFRNPSLRFRTLRVSNEEK